MTSSGFTVLTIGHSNHSLDGFIGLLRKQGVTKIADVRSVPYSQYNPQFNRESLEEALKGHGIEYIFLGRELGARPDDPACYENGRVRFERLARSDSFKNGIACVIRNARNDRLALMCAEKEPLDCHRTFLVAKALVKEGVAVKHILKDGALESHENTLKKSTGKVSNQGDMFPQERIREALALQENKIAYKNPAIKGGDT